MANAENVIRQSMRQTEDCQRMVRKLMEMCETLMAKVKELQIENKVSDADSLEALAKAERDSIDTCFTRYDTQ